VDTADTGGTVDTATDTEPEPVVTEETVEPQDADDSWFFSRETVHQIDITLPQASVDGLYVDPYTYVIGDVAINGEVLPDIGVRLRGKIGSFRSLDGKPKFKIDLNQFVDDQRFWGLETLSLNNEVVDYSYLKEPIAYALFEAVGVPGSRTSFAEVSVNGSPYGLYVIIETPDDAFLKRTYEDPSGNLYDGKYVWYGGYNYQLLDFASGVDDLYSLEEGTDVNNADIKRISSLLTASYGKPSFYDDMSVALNWDQVLRDWSVEQWIGQNDGYCLNTNNYRVYFDPLSGKADMLPWDYDYSFLYDWEWGMDWWNPRGNLCYACRIDPTCQAAWKEAMTEVVAAAAELDLVAEFDAMQALIYDAAYSDPRREAGWSSVEGEQGQVRAWLTTRSDEMSGEWGL
jgi:spore coat protein CotH